MLKVLNTPFFKFILISNQIENEINHTLEIIKYMEIELPHPKG